MGTMLDPQEIKYFFKIAEELSIQLNQVEATAKLLGEECTVPFIARYRKEVTGNLDEVQIITIRDRLEQLKQLDERRAAILKSLEENGHLTPELEKSVKEAQTLSKLEDIYLPYRPKRKTRGMKAKEQGLEPLAGFILAQGEGDPLKEAESYLNTELGVETISQAINGAKDIIAEIINEDVEIRQNMREFFEENAVLTSSIVKGKENSPEAAKFRDYFEWSEKALSAPSHRLLAIRRGAELSLLNYSILPEEESALLLLYDKYLTGETEIESGKINQNSLLVKEAAQDCYSRLLSLSMESEIRSELKKRADEKAIAVFAENLRELLLASPMGQKVLLALDPGLRTGCKLVCLDAQGKLLYNSAIYPLEPHNKKAEAEAEIAKVVQHYGVEAVAIGNGTGGRDCLSFCKELDCLKNKIVAMVNESGASVYSASEIARKEFPEYDVTVRGAVSIGRRLMDPLAELVKIDPKSIGVGQYQHDVDQKLLKNSLDDVVVSCVNAVGVDINTASFKLLGYVAGLSERLAERIVRHREINGPFKRRDQIKEVVGVGPKAFEQAAGFLRILGGENPLDASAVHPESYEVVQKMADDLNCSIVDLMKNEDLRRKIKPEKYVTESIGLPTLNDIMNELEKPGRDPRAEFDLFSFTEGVNEISDLRQGMILPGVVTNVTAFGAFVDVGVHQDGLVHISELSDSFVSDPASVVKVNQKVLVRVIEIDVERKRISLSMKSEEAAASENAPKSSASNKQKVLGVRTAVGGSLEPRKRVVVVSKKQGEGNPAANSLRKTTPSAAPLSRSSGKGKGRYLAQEEEGAYNPFAALLKKGDR